MRFERGAGAATPVVKAANLFAALTLAAAAMLGGCAVPFGAGTPRKADTPPPVDPAVTAAVLVANRLEIVQRLVEGTPAEQAQILATVKGTYDKSPTTPGDELEYALVLAAPGHSGSDPGHAQQLLQNVLDSPDSLMPSERALAVLVLRDVDRQLDLVAENQRLQVQSEQDDRERMAFASRRLQSEAEENARLRKELEKTRAQLNAITNIERSLNRRRSSAPAPSAPVSSAAAPRAPGTSTPGQGTQGSSASGQSSQEPSTQGQTTQGQTQ